MHEKPALGNELNQKHHSSTKMAAAWVLNEAAGDMIRDATGNRNTGTLAPTVYANLNGSSQYFYRTDIDFPESGITGANDFTLQAWIYLTDNAAGEGGIAAKYAAAGDKIMYYFAVYDDELRIHISDDGAAGTTKTTAGCNFAVNTWYHVAVVYDASAGTADFYKDGSFVEQETGLPVTIADKAPSFTVGAIGGSSYFLGGLYNLCLFDDMRSAGEIAVSAVSWDEDCSAEGNIIGQWMFNESGSAAAIDNTQGDAGRDLIPYDSTDDPEKSVSAITAGGTEATLTTADGADVFIDGDALLVSDAIGYGKQGFADGTGSGTTLLVDDGAGAAVTDIEKVGVSVDCDATYYAQAANNGVHDITTEDIGIWAWVKIPVGMSTHSFIVSKWVSGAGSYILFIQSGGGIKASIGEGGDNYDLLGTTDLRDNEWHFIAAVFDKSDAANCNLYIDGAIEPKTTSGALALIGSLTNTATLQLGRRPAYICDGSIAEAGICYPADIMAANEMGAAGEILALATNPHDPTAWPNSEDYWLLDENTGTTLTGQNNNLTLSNAAAWDQAAFVSKNLLTDADMEYGGIGGWKVGDAATTISKSTTQVHGDTYSLKVLNGDASQAFARQTITTVASEVYAFHGWFYAPTTINGASQLVDVDANPALGITCTVAGIGAGWNEVEFSFAAADASTTIDLGSGSVTNTEFGYWDEVKLSVKQTHFGITGRDTTYIGWQGGIHSPTILLDGRAQYASIPHADAFSFEHNDAFSVGVWVKSLETTDSVLRTIVGKYSSGSVGWRLCCDGATANDPIMFQINDGANTDWIQVDGDLLGDQEWHFLMATYDGSNSPSGMKIYMDGVPQTTSNSNDDVVGTIITTGDLLVGTDDSIIDYVNGFVNWLAVWHRAITPVEVLELQIEPFLPFTQPLDGALKHGVELWGNFREALAPPRLTPSNDLIFRFTYGGSDYDNLLPDSRVRRNASMGAGEATIVLDNSNAAWNGFHAGRNVLGDEGVVTMLLDDGLSTNTIKLFTGTVMQVDYDENRVIIKLRDKIYRALRVRIGSGQVPAIVDGYSPGKLAWHILTNEPDDPFPGMGLDDTENSGNIDIDFTQHWNWRNMLNGQGYELGAKLTGQTVKWALDRISKMTNSYIWQGGDGRITFAPPQTIGRIYSVMSTDEIGLSMVTDTIVNDITVYHNYDTDDGTWEGQSGTVGTAGTIAGDSWTQYGRISETDDSNIIFHNTADSAENQLAEQITTYASPIRMFGINAMLPAFEDDVAHKIIVTKGIYGVAAQIATIEDITYDLTTAKVSIRARWAW